MKTIWLTIKILTLTYLVCLAFVWVTAYTLNWKIYTVVSSSMEPAIHIGDFLVIKTIEGKEKVGIINKIKLGDVVTFENPENHNLPISHRVVSIQEDALGQFFIVAKGDSPSTVNIIYEKNLYGRLIFKIPGVIYIPPLNTLKGMMLLVIFPLMLLARTFKNVRVVLFAHPNNLIANAVLTIMRRYKHAQI